MARPCGCPEFRRGRPDFSRRRGRRGDGSRRAANRSILRRGRARCGCHTARALGRGRARSDGHMPRFMRSCAVVHAPARRLTCGRAAAPAIVRRGSCDCALRLMLEEGTKRTNGERAPARMGGGARFGTGARCCRIVFAAGLGRCVRSGAAQFLRGWPDCARKCDGRGDGCAACGVRLTGLFSWRGGAVRPAWRLAQAFFAARQAGRWGRGVRRATNRTIFVAGLGRCARHGDWPKRFLRRGRRGDGARRAACD